MSGANTTPNLGNNRVLAAFLALLATLVLGPGVGSAVAAADGPTAAFTFPDVVHAGKEIQFDASTSTPSGEITKYSWDFGGEGTAESTEALASHVFSGPGDYLVRLTIAVAGCPSSCEGSMLERQVIVTDPGLEFTVPAVGQRIKFGNQAVGSGPTSAFTFTVRSSGRTPVTIKEIAIPDDLDNQFSILQTGQAGTCAPGTLEPGATCTVDVVFDPSISRRTDATLTISSDADDSPQTRAIWGTGTDSSTTNSCKKVYVKRTKVRAPTGSAKGRDPGLAVSIRTSSAAIVRVRIRVTYRRSGHPRALIFRERVLRVNKNGLLSVTIPEKLRPALHRGKKVLLEVRTRVRTPKKGCVFSKPNTIIFETHVG